MADECRQVWREVELKRKRDQAKAKYDADPQAGRARMAAARAAWTPERHEAAKAYARARRVLVTCEACGTQWEAHDKGKNYQGRRACSLLCRYFVTFGEWPACDLPTERPTHELACARCSTSFSSTVAEALYCSERCQRLTHEDRKKIRRKAAVPTYVAGRCLECDAHFVDRWQAESSSQYCSLRCGRRAANSARRARKRAAFVAPVRRGKIFERDNWTCHLCRRPVKRGAVVPHPLAPTLDHVIPLARGGTHEPANVRCAHFLCNSLKGDGAAGEQLLLFG